MFRASARRMRGQEELDEAARVLVVAQQTADHAIEDPRNEAALIVAAAHREAAQVVADAQTRGEPV
jgi:cell division septum initiation protein DivIVA